MKLLYVIDNLSHNGGVERIITDKANLFAANGYEVVICTAEQENKPFVYPLSKKVRHVNLGVAFWKRYACGYPKRFFVKMSDRLQFRIRLGEVLDTESPDIVLIPTHYYFSALACRIARRFPIIIESHFVTSEFGLRGFAARNKVVATLLKKKKDIDLWIMRRRAAVAVALTEGDAAFWKGTKRVVIIPNCTSPGPDFAYDSSSRAVLAAGRLCKEKAFDRLIPAWAGVAQKHPDWTLDIFGEGEEKGRLDKMIEEAHLGDVVKIHPFSSTLAQEMRSHAFYAMTSRTEGFPMVLIESLMNSLPIVAMDCPYGPGAIVHNKENGLLTADGDIAAYSDALNNMIGDETLRADLARGAFDASRQYLPEAILPQWQQLFNELAK